MSDLPGHPPARILAAEVALTLLLVGVLTATALAVFPIHDDTYTLILEEEGGQAIRAHHQDRPMMAATWGFFTDRGLLWPMAAVAHALAWLGMAGVSYGLWRRLGAASPHLAWSALLLAVTPILCHTQLDLLNPVFASHAGPVLAYGAFLLHPERSWPRSLAGGALIVLGTLLSEYAVPATAVVCVLLLAEGWRGSQRELRRAVTTAGALGATALLSYGAYVTLADSASRTVVHPTVALDLWRLKVLPFRFVTSLWQGSVGGLMDSGGAVTINSVPAALSLFAGVALALCTVWMGFRWQQRKAPAKSYPTGWWVAVGFLALAVGLTPILLMGRLPGQEFDSRFWLPLLPLTACLTTALGAFLLRQKWLVVLPLTVSFLGGFALAERVQGELRHAQRTERWSEEIRPHLIPGKLTLAVFHIPFDHGWSNLRDFQLSARLSKDWSEEERAAFWAVPADFEQVEWYGELTGVGLGGITGTPHIDWNLRGYGRQGEIHQILWVTVGRDGALSLKKWGPP